MTLENIITAIIGGTLIGASATGLLLINNRVAGISGIAASLIAPWNSESRWKWCFTLGLLSSGVLYRIAGYQPSIEISASYRQLIIAGLLVGFGSRLAGGCTSGHGICGIARLSVRSIVATLTFMLTAGLTVYITAHAGVMK